MDLTLASCQRSVLQRTDHAVPEAETAARLSRLHTSSQTAPGLVGEVLQEQRIHRPLQANMQMIDLSFRQGDNANANERQPFEEPGGVLLIAAETVKRFCQHDVEPTFERITHERLKTC